MLNQSVNYTPQEDPPYRATAISANEDVGIFFMSGMIPINFAMNALHSDNYRDVVLGTLLSDESYDETVLDTYLRKIRSLSDSYEDHSELQVFCEHAATLAYAWGNSDLAKKVLMRVNPEKASAYVKTLYTAIEVHKMPSDKLKAIVSDGLSVAKTRLAAEKLA